MIRHDKKYKTITLTVPDGNLSLLVDYNNGCAVRKLYIKGENTLSASGAYTGITLKDKEYASGNLEREPDVQVNENTVIIKHIRFGQKEHPVEECWNFRLKDSAIIWKITRNYAAGFEAEDMALAGWHFKDLSVWKGGIIDNGGMVWCKYLKNTGDTYGVHTGGTIFWNEHSGNGLSIQAKGLNGALMATKYSKNSSREFTSTQLATYSMLKQRHHLSRFVAGSPDVFAPFLVEKGKIETEISIAYVDYFKQFDRGTLKNIKSAAVRELLNTTARYGVVDNNIVGGNGWLTNWKCLHEPFFAQIALALNDSNYTKNLVATLDQERDQAMHNGRVLSRWHDVPGDEMPGTYNSKTGYYEAIWGYTVDSQTGYLLNVCETFDLTGNLAWLKTHQQHCEAALEWLLSRDENNNGIFEMVNRNIHEKKSSDWLDIVWAGYENAFVNAQLYGALVQWADCEKLLGNLNAANRYTRVAARLKEAFNKTVKEGGFWLPEKKQYVYWRDDDGSVHGDNLVTPVNFGAIAFGICDDKARIKTILDEIEKRTREEHLFHWPLCFDSFKREEVEQGNWPFPNYENGDIFPTWGYLGVRSYLKYNQQLALKYINNLLDQYEKDGLSSQRYSRKTGLGLGTDVLAGICTGVTALYSDIYGVQPKWNRLMIAPAALEELNGTSFPYVWRDTVYHIGFRENVKTISNAYFSVSGIENFGVSGKPGRVIFFPGKQDTVSLSIFSKKINPIQLKMEKWNADSISWKMQTAGMYVFELKGLNDPKDFILSINNKQMNIPADKMGNIKFQQELPGNATVTLTTR